MKLNKHTKFQFLKPPVVFKYKSLSKNTIIQEIQLFLFDVF